MSKSKIHVPPDVPTICGVVLGTRSGRARRCGKWPRTTLTHGLLAGAQARLQVPARAPSVVGKTRPGVCCVRRCRSPRDSTSTRTSCEPRVCTLNLARGVNWQGLRARVVHGVYVVHGVLEDAHQMRIGETAQCSTPWAGSPGNLPKVASQRGLPDLAVVRAVSYFTIGVHAKAGGFDGLP